MSKQKSTNFELITGLWKRVSTMRVGKDGKPEVYYVGSPRGLEEGESITINHGDVMHLYPSTNPGKKGSPTWFLKIKRANGQEVVLEPEVSES